VPPLYIAIYTLDAAKITLQPNLQKMHQNVTITAVIVRKRMKSITYGGGGFEIGGNEGNSVIWKTPRVGIAKKLGGGYIMGNFGRQR
jgi:hypothetical protein